METTAVNEEVKFKELTLEAKKGILVFLKKEKINKVVFTFKEAARNHLSKRNINIESICLLGNLKTVGQIKNVSSDGVITIFAFGQEVSLAIEYIEDVSIYKQL